MAYNQINVPMTVPPDEESIPLTVSVQIGGGAVINNQNKTIHPSASDQSIQADNGYTGIGTATVKKVVVKNLTASNVVSGVTVKIGDEDDDDSIASVAGTASSGGITPTGTKEISITQNGTTTTDVTNYADAEITVAVPNSYSAGDEGKVVDNGALVAQGSDTVTANDTYDTTLINSLTVNVSGGGTTPTGFLNETVITATEGVSGSNNSLSLMQTLEPELMENGNRHFYLFFFLNNSLTNKAALFSWCVHHTDTAWSYGSCRHANGTLTWIQGNSHDFWYSAGTEIHILEFDSLLGLGA